MTEPVASARRLSEGRCLQNVFADTFRELAASLQLEHTADG